MTVNEVFIHLQTNWCNTHSFSSLPLRALTNDCVLSTLFSLIQFLEYSFSVTIFKQFWLTEIFYKEHQNFCQLLCSNEQDRRIRWSNLFIYRQGHENASVITIYTLNIAVEVYMWSRYNHHVNSASKTYGQYYFDS